MQYQKTRDTENNETETIVKLVKADGTICFIPNDPANRDWQEYQAWLAQGNEPEPAE